MSSRATRRAIPKPGILALLGLAEFMLVLDVSIVNVALPAIRGDLGFSQSELEWVVNGYALTFGGFLLLGGRAADVFGGRAVFLVALSAFSLASLACGLAGGQVALVVARVIQGLSAGVLSPATLSMLTATYVAPAERSRALSIWTAVAIGGGAVGALLGGILTDVLSWRGIFFVNVPVGALLVALALSRLPRGAAGLAPRRLDLAGVVTVTGGLVALIWALVRSSGAGWGSGEVIGGLAAALVLLGAFAVIEARVGTPHVTPVGFSHNPDHDSIDIGGFELEQTKKYRDIQRTRRAAVVIDDNPSVDPWRVRGIEIRGPAEALARPQPLIRIHAKRIIAWGIDSESSHRHARNLQR